LRPSSNFLSPSSHGANTCWWHLERLNCIRCFSFGKCTENFPRGHSTGSYLTKVRCGQSKCAITIKDFAYLFAVIPCYSVCCLTFIHTLSHITYNILLSASPLPSETLMHMLNKSKKIRMTACSWI
jgi:hypothetical protein